VANRSDAFIDGMVRWVGERRTGFPGCVLMKLKKVKT